MVISQTLARVQAILSQVAWQQSDLLFYGFLAYGGQYASRTQEIFAGFVWQQGLSTQTLYNEELAYMILYVVSEVDFMMFLPIRSDVFLACKGYGG